MKVKITLDDAEKKETKYRILRGIVREQTLRAYSDVNNHYECERDLDFRASYPVSPQDAVEIMCDALSVLPDQRGYNDFYPAVLGKLSDPVILAREHSVCVYVEKRCVETAIKLVGHQHVLHSLVAEELYLHGLFYRIWWD